MMKQPLTPDESLIMLTRVLERLDLFVAAPTLDTQRIDTPRASGAQS